MVPLMWRLHVLARFLREWGLLQVGLTMIDGSWYREEYAPEYPDPPDHGGYE